MAVLAVASAVQGSLGFGAALLAAPLLLLIHPAFAPGPIMVSTFVLTMLVARREFEAIDYHSLRFIVLGRLVGVALAMALLVRLSQTGFDLVFGVFVLISVALSALRIDFGRSPAVFGAAGLASGLMGTVSSIGGPPVAIVYPHDDPARFRATLSAHFIIGGVVSLLALFAIDLFGETELLLSALLIPAAAVGFWISRYGIRHVDAPRLRAAVLVLSSVAGLVVLARALLGFAGQA